MTDGMDKILANLEHNARLGSITFEVTLNM